MNHESTEHSKVAYRSYIIGFILSIITTLLAYYLVVNKVWEPSMLVYAVLGIAVIQLVVQVVFFLHVGRGSTAKLITFLFTLLVVAILVVGTVWVMNHLNHGLMNLSPAEQQQYMSEHEGI